MCVSDLTSCPSCHRRRPTVKEMREKYPDPAFASGRYGKYCIGGMLFLEEGIQLGFPRVVQLAEKLREWNPALSATDAAFIASRIVANNDRGDFCTAADWLERGLGFDKKRKSMEESIKETREFLSQFDETRAAVEAVIPVTEPAKPVKKKRKQPPALLQYSSRRPIVRVRAHVRAQRL